nr:hypothetical protein [uncultured Cupriavidus sp.]
MTTMTADQFRDFPEPDHSHARTRQTGRARTGTERLQDAGIIFGGIAVALAGIFGILELSARNASQGTNAIISRLDTLQYSQVELNDRVARLEASVDQRLGKGDDRSEARFDKIDERFVRLETKFDERFQKVDERFVKLETKFDERFVRLETKFDERFQKVDERFARLETKFDKQFERMDEKFERMTDVLLQLIGQKVVPGNTAVKTGSPGKPPSR